MRIKKAFTVVLLLVATWSASLTMMEYYQTSTSEAAHDLLLDEGFVLGPVMRLYENGLTSFRCRDNSTSSCYGFTQYYLDAIFLKLLPHSWLESVELLPYPGTNWFHSPKYPQIAKSLRVMRVFYAFIIGVFIFAFARRVNVNVYPSLLAAIGIFSFSSFVGARLGMKPDMPAGAWTPILFFLYFLAFQEVRTKKARLRLFFAAAMSTASLGVRFSFILPYAMFATFYLSYGYLKGVAPKELLKRSMMSLGISLGCYLLLNPNFWISTTEASWFLNYLAHPNMSASFSQRFQELLHLAIPNAWPMVLAALLVFGLLKRKKGKEAQAEWIYWGFFFGLPFIWALLNLKGSWGRPHYYLSVAIWSMMLLTMILSRVNSAKWISNVLMICFLATAVQARGWELTRWTETELLYWKEKGQDSRDIVRDSGPWLIDSLVRAPLRKSEVNPRIIKTFDSFSESPDVVLSEAKNFFKKLAIPLDSVRVLLPCWRQEIPKGNGSRYSPSADRWSQIVEPYCKKTERIADHIFPFEYGNVPDRFTVVRLSQLKSPGRARLFPGQTRLNPRVFRESIHGIDYWYSPLVFYRDLTIQGTFEFPRAVKRVALPFESQCKGRGALTLELLNGNQVIASQAVQADVRNATCQLYPLVCRAGIEQWWTKRFPVNHLNLPVDIPANSIRTLRIRGEGLDRDACRISMKNLELEL